MKKLLLVTGICMGLGLMASAQEKKAATLSATNTQPAQKKKAIKTLQQERTAKKIAIEKENGTKGRAAKKGSTAPGARETMATKVN